MGLFFSQASFSWQCRERAPSPLACPACPCRGDSLWRSLRDSKRPCGGKKPLQGTEEVVSHHSDWALEGELPLVKQRWVTLEWRPYWQNPKEANPGQCSAIICCICHLQVTSVSVLKLRLCAWTWCSRNPGDGISDSVLAFPSLPDPGVGSHQVPYGSPKADDGVIAGGSQVPRVPQGECALSCGRDEVWGG